MTINILHFTPGANEAVSTWLHIYLASYAFLHFIPADGQHSGTMLALLLLANYVHFTLGKV